MGLFCAVDAVPPGVPAGCAGRLVEVDRLEWRVADGGDPAALVEAFCREYGALDAGGHAGGVCGVGLLVGAAAGAVMAGGEPGAPSPVGAVPDVAAVAFAHGPVRPVAVPGGFAVGLWRRSWSRADHAKAVVAVQEAIGRGEVYQACVVGHRRASWRGDPGAVVSALRGLDGAVCAGALSGADWLVVSASPERFLRVRDGVASTFPIKGTAAATAEGRAWLSSSVKERAEHVMIVDLERNDLSRVAVPGSVAVPRLFAVRRWAGLWQAESAVECRLADGVGLADLLRAVCPPGSVTGTPKLSMLDLVGGLEPVGRGPAMGALGFVGGGSVDLGLTIRTVALDAGSVHLWAGGGITWRSDPAAEVAEAEAKAAGVRAALGGLA